MNDQEIEAIMKKTEDGVKELREKYWPHEIKDRDKAYEEYMRRLGELNK